MKRSTRRALKRFLQNPLNIVAAVFTTVGVILTPLVPPSSGWLWVALSLSLVGLAWLLVYLYRAASVPVLCYFEGIRFGNPSNYAMTRAAYGLLNGEKALPEFVHAAPRNKEVQAVCHALHENGFSTLYGGPGEGKSMTAYHAAYRLYQEAGYCPYAIRVDLLGDKSGQDFRDDLLEQLDRLKGKRKLIIVDDAHKLADRKELYRLMQQEASDGVLKVVWIETEFYEEAVNQRLSSHIRIDFGSLIDQVVSNLYRSHDVNLQYVLQGKVEGLDEAIAEAKAGEIRDVWHFAFVASRGGKRVQEEINKLDNAETLVLFLISAHAVISGETDLSMASFLSLLGGLGFGWLRDSLRGRAFSDAIRSLQEYRFEPTPDKGTIQRMSLIRLYNKTVNDRGYIASLHYNSARAIVAGALQKKPLERDLIESLRVFLTPDFRHSAYMCMLLRALGSKRAVDFFRSNEGWFTDFLSNPVPESIEGCAATLRSLRSRDADGYRMVVERLNLDTLARGLHSVGVNGLGSLAGLLHALGDKRMALLEKVAWKDFAPQVAVAEIDDFRGAADLLSALDEGQCEALLGNLTGAVLERLAGLVAGAKINQFEAVASFLTSLGGRRDALLGKLTEMDGRTGVVWTDLAAQVSGAEIERFEQVARLLNALGDKRSALLDRLSNAAWEDLAARVSGAQIEKFQHVAPLLSALRDRRAPLLERVNIASLVRTANGPIPELREGTTRGRGPGSLRGHVAPLRGRGQFSL
jgi:hypothetical protein